MNPLESNPQRQAIPTLRGYSYQIWQSLLRWLELRENEDLFLEGAEDIDILGPSGIAETVQVKETAESGAITLRSADVLEAINNFWEHQSKNPHTTIIFRFLTTSERGWERPKEFGKKRGLDFWDSCKREGIDNQPLRDFLSKQPALSDELREFIKDASDDDLRQKLLLRFEWDTGVKPQPFVEDVVRHKIVEYGDAVYRLPPSVSEKTISHLLRRVWEVVRRKDDRRLTREDFLTAFEEATTERVPVHELQKLKRAAAAVAGTEMSNPAAFGSPFASTQSFVNSINSSILEPLTLPDLSRFADRAELVARLRDELDDANTLVLIGSTGTGKSLLSYKIADATGGAWRRLDLRGFSPEQIRDRLAYAARLIEDETEIVDCIVDDLNFDGEARVYENALGRFLYAVGSRGGRVIFTSHHKPPARVTTLYDLPENGFTSVPPLGEEDVKDLLVKHRCPAGHQLKAWTRLIHLHTRGHALLTHTRVRTLANEGWRTPDEKDLLVAEEIKDVKGEFRRSLREQMPEDARTLLYRLSVFVQRFKRSHALSMGNHTPAISMTGDAFDTLVGPWIEPVDAMYFRLSPLLDDAATEVFTPAQIKELHRAAAEAFLAEKVINVIELDAVLYHGLLGEATLPLAAAAMSVFSADKDGWKEIAQISRWFAHARSGGKEKLFESDHIVNFLLRRMQFKILAELDPQKGVALVKIIESEINEWDGSNSYPGTKENIRFAFLSDIIFEMEVPFPIKQVTDWVLQMIQQQKDKSLFFPEHPEHKIAVGDKLKILTTPTVYVRVATARCREAAQVVELLAAFDESTDEAAAEVWSEFKTDNFMASTLVDAVWLSESRKNVPDWTGCLKTLDLITEIAHKHDATALAAAIYQAKAIVYKEYLHDSQGAFESLQEGEAALGESEFFLEDYRAKIYFMEKNYAEAIKIWRAILPRIENDGNAARTFSFRDAEVCASRLGEWDEAADLALRGEAVARLPFIEGQPEEVQNNVLSESIAVGYRADYAFALWKAGKRAEAVAEFADILDAFENLPAPSDDLRVNLLFRRVGYAIGWFLQDIKDNDEFEEPPPGFFSNPEKVDEIKDAPLQPMANCWYLLARLEYKLRLGDHVFRRFTERRDASNGDFSNADIGFEDLRLRHSLVKLEVENLVSQYLTFSESSRKFAVAQTGIEQTCNDVEVLKALTFTSLLLYASRGQQHLLPLADWKREADHEQNALDPSFSDWLKFVEKFVNGDRATWVAALANQTASNEERILGALMLSANAENIDAETRFYANTILLTANYSGDWRDEAADAIEYWIVKGWREIVERQQFTLQIPNVNAPIILAACDDKASRGIGRAAQVLLTVRPAVRLNVSNVVIVQLQDLAENISKSP